MIKAVFYWNANCIHSDRNRAIRRFRCRNTKINEILRTGSDYELMRGTSFNFMSYFRVHGVLRSDKVGIMGNQDLL